MENPTREWFVAELDLAVVVSEPALESMRRAAMVGLQKIPRRGLEIGGVLFGRRSGNRIEIHQWREIECEHARGPGFSLSEKDEKALAELLETAREDPTLGQFEAVGLFRTRTRGELMVLEEDAAFFDRYFPEPWQLLLVIRPHMYEPARVGFFLRDRDGRMAGRPVLEAQLELRRRRLPLDFDPAERPRRGPREPARVPPAPPGSPGVAAPPSPGPGGVSAPIPEPLPYPGNRPPGRRLSGRRLAAIAAAVALAAFAVILTAPLFSDRVAGNIDLGVHQVGDQFVVEWNPRAPVIRTAVAASLEITDGESRRRLELSPVELRGGSFTYRGAGKEVTFSLRVKTADGKTVTEAARRQGTPARQPAVSKPAPQSGTADLEAEISRLRSELDQERRRAQELQQAIETKRRGLAAHGR